MDNLNIEERFDRIEKLLLSTKTVLTFDEACEYTGYSRNYLYKLTAPKSVVKIPHYKPNNKSIFFKKEELDNWLLQNKSKSTYEIEQEALRYTHKNKKA